VVLSKGKRKSEGPEGDSKERTPARGGGRGPRRHQKKEGDGKRKKNRGKQKEAAQGKKGKRQTEHWGIPSGPDETPFERGEGTGSREPKIFGSPEKKLQGGLTKTTPKKEEKNGVEAGDRLQRTQQTKPRDLAVGHPKKKKETDHRPEPIRRTRAKHITPRKPENLGANGGPRGVLGGPQQRKKEGEPVGPFKKKTVGTKKESGSVTWGVLRGRRKRPW